MRNKLSVVIVNYNVKFYLEQCLHSLSKALVGIASQVYVVDNNSHDSSVEYLKEKYPSVCFIASNHNYGFAYANNIALRKCDSEYVLLLNPDTFIGESVLHEMLTFMDKNEKVGGAGLQMLNAFGKKAMESRRGLPEPMVAFYKMCGLCARYPKSKRFGKYYMSYLSWDTPEQIEVISGACMLVRLDVLRRLNYLDEDFFMYGEDIDLSYRILKAGYENWYLPLKILHYKGESTQKSSFRYVHVFYQAMLIFFRKHYKHLAFWFSLPIKTAIYAKAFLSLVSIQGQVIRKILGLKLKRRITPKYLFIGDRKMIEKAKTIALEKGLEADYIVGNEISLPTGHQISLQNPNTPYVVVYDVHSFSYEKILEIFSLYPMKNVSLGTFNPDTNVVITYSDIIK